MKKQLLLGSTALIVGALAVPDFAVAEEKLKLSVRGYKNEYFAVGSVNNDQIPGQDTTSEFSDGEIHFKGSTELDNGLTFGVDVQLESFASGDQIDEAYTWVSGDFGKVVIGSENLPDYLTFWGVTAPGVGVPINSGWISIWAPNPAPTATGEPGIGTGFRSSLQTTNLTLQNDTFQIGYQSPRFSGFQFVAGYSPTSAGGSNSGDPKNAPTDTDLDLMHDIISVGANFSESFNGVDVGVAAGYEYGSVGDLITTDDQQIFKVGASLGASGFTIAGSYGVYDSDLGDEGQSYDVGVSYSTGPWGVSATYFHGEEEGSAAISADDEVDAIVGAVSYSIGPGITGSLSIFYGKWEEENGVIESDSTMGIVGLAISF